MIRLGKTNTLTIIRDTPVGMFLGETEDQVILLPKKYIQPEFKVGDQVDVFVYKDSEDRLVATTQEPWAEVDQFASLHVSEVSRLGAFLDWGLEKDLLVPFREQKVRMQEGSAYVVFIYVDEVTERIVASSKVNKFISNETLSVKAGDEVDLMVYGRTPMGYNCIVNAEHKGLLYANEVFRDISIGDQLKGYIKLVRENNLIDLSLQKPGFKHVLSSTEQILDYLMNHDGFLAMTDQSSPEEIMKRFNMSKATFKKTLGILYRQRKVILEDKGVRLVKKPEGPIE
jgi:uncharacterized protein